tara:strand:+ start:251 stop:637 length:387 start_codon:yes stop_codon:yes gene_type:complete
MTGTLEHTNLTVTDPHTTASWLCDVFGWHVRWQGDAISGGHTVHVGTPGSYLALYRPEPAPAAAKEGSNYTTIGGLNHVGITVPELAVVEARVKAAGFTPHSHADYEPGKRFYFHDLDGIEFEVVSYA